MTIMTRGESDFQLNHLNEIQVLRRLVLVSDLSPHRWRESFARSSCSIFFQEFS